MPGTSREQALAAAENVRRLIAEHDFAHAAAQPLGCLSISGGVATGPIDPVLLPEPADPSGG